MTDRINDPIYRLTSYTIKTICSYKLLFDVIRINP